MSANGGPYVPTAKVPERPVCSRLPCCHPGKAYSEAFCRVKDCRCHVRLT